MTTFHLETTAGALADALTLVAPVIPKRAAFPVLKCVLLDERRMTGTNLEQTLCASFAALRMRGKLAVDAHALGVVNLLPADAPITLAYVKGSALLSFPGGSYDLLAFPHGDFPDPMHTGDWETVGGNGATNLPRALAAVRFAISTEETRYYLNGACLSKKDGENVVVATDGHRLAWQKAHVPWPDRWDGIIVPHAAVHLLVHLGQCDQLGVLFTDRQEPEGPDKVMVTKRVAVALRAKVAGVTLTTKLIDGTFPDWHRLVPQGLGGTWSADNKAPDDQPSTVKMAVPVAEVQRALARLKAGSAVAEWRSVTLDPSRGHPLVLTSRPDPDRLLVEVIASDAGETVPAGPARKTPITFNAFYLSTLLKHLPDPVAVLQTEADDGGSPTAVVHDQGGHVLMPMRGNALPADLLADRLSALTAPSEAA